MIIKIEDQPPEIQDAFHLFLLEHGIETSSPEQYLSEFTTIQGFMKLLNIKNKTQAQRKIQQLKLRKYKIESCKYDFIKISEIHHPQF